jgi:hypothetical protein
LNPRTRTSFPDWCKKIESHLQTGQLFKPEAVEEDLFPLLPTFWHGMVPAERQGVIDLIAKDGFSPAVLRELQKEFKIESKDWTNILTCHNVCKNKPESCIILMLHVQASCFIHLFIITRTRLN